MSEREELDVESVDELVDRVDALVEEGELGEAEALLDEGAERFDDPLLKVLRAQLALDAGEYDECVVAADHGLGEVEDKALRAELLEARGWAQYYLDELEEARESLNSAVKEGGATWDALVGRAMVHEELLYFRAALLDLERAIAIDDQEPQPFAIRGSIHLRRGRLEEAERDLGYAVEIDPQEEESRLNLARLQATDQRSSEAMETLEPLVEEGERAEWVMPAALLRSQLSLTLGSTEAAEEDAQRAIDVAPEQPWGYLQLAACYITAVKPGEAIAAIKEAESRVDDGAQIPDVFALRASAYEQLEKFDKAKEMQDQAEGTAQLPGIVYGQWLNPARNVPVNPNRSIDARTLMEQLFDDPSQAPEGYEEALRQVVDQIPEMIRQNPEAEKIRVPLPKVKGMAKAPPSLVLQVNRDKSKEP